MPSLEPPPNEATPVDSPQFRQWLYSLWAVTAASTASITSIISASLVSFIQLGFGAVTRTIQDKARDIVSVKDFGATGTGLSDDAFAFTAAGSIAAKVTVLVPLGIYLITALPAPSGIVIWDIQAGVIFTGANASYFTSAGSNDQKTQITTTGTDFATQYIRRNSNYTGGTPGVVNAGLRVDTYAGINAAAYEWSIVGVVYNSATGGQNVGGYFQGNRVTAGAGPTWGGVCEVIEQVPITNPTTGLIGLEVDNRSNGTDLNNNRVGVDAVLMRKNVTGAATEVGYGYRVQTRADLGVTVKTGYGFDYGTNVSVGFDASLALVGQCGFKLAEYQPFCWDAAATQLTSYDTAGIAYLVSGVKKSRLSKDGSIELFDLRTKISGDFATGTTTPVLSSNKPGTTTDVAVWMDVVIDGAPYCFPVWSKA